MKKLLYVLWTVFVLFSLSGCESVSRLIFNDGRGLRSANEIEGSLPTKEAKAVDYFEVAI
jgi:hypothetical protein